MGVLDYSTSASLNTAISGIDIGENCARANMNNALRQLMADIAVSTVPSLHVRAFGAVGDGATNDTNALAAAIAAAKSLKCWLDFGGSDKTYMTDQITLTSDHYWKSTGATLKARDGLNQDIMRGSNVSNIWIGNLNIDGNMPATLTRVGTFGQGIHLLKGSNVILRNVKAINCLENGLRIVGISQGWFEKCEGSYCGHNGMYFSGYSDGTADLSDCHIIGPVTSYNATDGLAFEFGTKHIQVIAPRSLNNGAGNGVATCPYVGGAGIIVIGYDATQFPEDVVISDGYTSENYGGGYYILGSVAVTLDNPRSSNDGMDSTVAETTFGHAIAVYSTSAAHIENRDITINNPTINNCAKHGIWLDDGLTAGGENKGVQIVGGVIRNPGLKQSNSYDGISAQNTIDLAVTGTVVYDDGSPQFMRYACSLAATCVNPRVIVPNFHAGLTGTISNACTTTQLLFVDYTNGKMMFGYGTAASPGAAFELIRVGTGTVDLKVRNTNVTAGMFVDSGFAYFGSTTAHPVPLLYNSVEVLRLDNGRATMAAPLKLKSYTVATLPGSPVAGDCALVTDANATTFNSTVAGGGANVVKVYYNGTNWKIG